ncbi:hypothetical protein BASA62_009131 [Batrachochytrium salamandrivorans]|nr:hypothetical protein BASA62_009131 [Batrachochytrium salamandrivorans]
MPSLSCATSTMLAALAAVLQLAVPTVLAQEGSGVGGATGADFLLQRFPQFITLTFDDSINEVILPQILNYTSNYINPNGCPLAATFFISTQYTNFWHVNRMFSSGHEIATHTMNHVGNPPVGEITGAVTALNAFGGVPTKMLTGLPYSIPGLHPGHLCQSAHCFHL